MCIKAGISSTNLNIWVNGGYKTENEKLYILFKIIHFNLYIPSQ